MGQLARTLAATVLAVASTCAPAATPDRRTDARRTVLDRCAPSYPELARRMHISGDVVVTVAIRPDGTVSETHVQSGHALLRQAAEQAVRRWRFAAGPSAVISVAVSFAPPLN